MNITFTEWLNLKRLNQAKIVKDDFILYIKTFAAPVYGIVYIIWSYIEAKIKTQIFYDFNLSLFKQTNYWPVRPGQSAALGRVYCMWPDLQ